MSKKTSVKAAFEQSRSSHFDPYKINNSEKEIQVKVIPGDNGQSSVTEAWLEDKAVLKNHAGPLDWFTIGSNQSLRGKYLELYTAVTDVPGQPDKTSFDFRIRGGVSPYKYYAEKTVTTQGASVLYKISIFFTIH